jgi:hypothetical protein
MSDDIKMYDEKICRVMTRVSTKNRELLTGMVLRLTKLSGRELDSAIGITDGVARRSIQQSIQYLMSDVDRMVKFMTPYA